MSKTFMSFCLLYTKARASFYGIKRLSFRFIKPNTVLYKQLKQAHELAEEYEIPARVWIKAQMLMGKRVGHFPYPSQLANEGALERALELNAECKNKKSKTPVKKWLAGYRARIKKLRADKEAWFQFIDKDFSSDPKWTGSDNNNIKIVYYRLDKIKYHAARKPKVRKKLKKRLRTLASIK